MRPAQAGAQRTLGQAKRLKRGVKRRLSLFHPPAIVPFRGHGTPTQVFVAGRVLECTGVMAPGEERDTGPWRNLRRAVRRLESDEIAGACLELQLGEARVRTTADEEGYFHVALTPARPLEHGWHKVQLRLVESIAGGDARAEGEVLVPDPAAEFAIVSDLDDTVLSTHATSRLGMTYRVLFRDAHSRTPFPGVAAFYRALCGGPDARGHNPLFYLSRSPWNLYDMFERFLAVNDIPRGPVFLRDASVLEAPSRALGAGQGKTERLAGLLTLYPELRFVLVGDSGQQDPEVYRDTVRAFPGRVRAVYIRDVTSKKRDAEVHAISEEVRGLGVPMVLVRDTAHAAEHAVERGLIRAEALEKVREAMESGGPG